MFSLIPKSEESICHSVRFLKENKMERISLKALVRRDTELNEKRRHGSDETDNKINAKRQKLNLDLPGQIIIRIRALPLESQAREEVQAQVVIRSARVQLWKQGQAYVFLEEGEEVQDNPLGGGG